MKALLLLIAFVFSIAVADIGQVRQKYIAAAESAAAAEQLYDMLDNVPDGGKEYTMLAYKAASIMMQAKYASGLLTKKRLFEKGVKLLEEVIVKDPDNYEARMIRFSIQDNAPRITGYRSDIASDKAFLIKHYNIQPAALKAHAKNFVRASSSFTKEEKAAF